MQWLLKQALRLHLMRLHPDCLSRVPRKFYGTFHGTTTIVPRAVRPRTPRVRELDKKPKEEEKTIEAVATEAGSEAAPEAGSEAAP